MRLPRLLRGKAYKLGYLIGYEDAIENLREAIEAVSLANHVGDYVYVSDLLETLEEEGNK